MNIGALDYARPDSSHRQVVGGVWHTRLALEQRRRLRDSWLGMQDKPTYRLPVEWAARSRYINSTGDRGWAAIRDSESCHIRLADLIEKTIPTGQLQNA